MKADIFESVPVPKAVTKLALPTVLGMIVTVIYNLADTFFVGQLNDEYQMAAVTIAMPVFMVLMSLGSIFGVGGGTFISRLLGNKNGEMAKKTASFCFYGCLGLSVLCLIGGLIFMDPILTVSGASDFTREFARQYMMVIVIGAPAVMLSFSMGQTARAEGASKEAMIGMVIGTVINIGLDPLLIFVFDMGVFGAAIATVIANAVSVLYYIWYFIFKSKNLTISPRYFSMNRAVVRNTFAIGTPAFLNNLLFSASSLILNRFAVAYGDNVVAALGIVNKVNMFPVMILIGLAQGVQPLLGYNYAAGNRKRLKDILKFTGIVGTIIGVAFTIFLFFANHFAVQIFIQKPEVVELGAQFLRVFMISVPILSLLFLFTNAFEAMGKAIPSMILSISRQGFIFIPLIIVANILFKQNGIVYAQPISDVASTIIAVLMFVFVWKKEYKNKPISEKAPDSVETIPEVEQSVAEEKS